ncbi:2-succinyl-5-enolpyruvyl-6-hydroxy-3-cyclohexene-1-carboxylic-acid synthase [Agromyces atrinae]|uniref:2-succinyl-5-enolpyruvyl-6-hydroxy-3-cyclohexene-1-carboxylate synthase n=1 Tax=Agromyces atrinae TaxID=592376 RepID=A0A4V1R2D9_9MICO|nr:2-succinyl-5-enolpyruvyl-6-hydroxy-3-cyclohexene-1-carboxylic-acid synthase [Agromyces atrinae]NYD67357.1 2-succinyl-5-enolpyruvyl-6-hydroxy-3-cyclohexene-1-carboxylate synthase [Agromyces atrinae]RXZ86816.1 2-succinyl-5-enolpyruvyl-6-hydroxy-3-cyclohexene-1-carboxylic-acid synthase [Agromyces atrinae]
MATASPATDVSVAILGAFIDAGVTDIIVCPGSRSQALALAAAAYEARGSVRLHVRLDERGAGFLALGLAVESGRPALVITTSGTAVANLHPAVLEAYHSGVPLIALTADRPAELRGIRANQTTIQPGIFARALRLERDVAAPSGEPSETDAAGELAREAYRAAVGADESGVAVADPGAGPVHLNLQFREPLSAPLDELPAVTPPASSAPLPADLPVATLAHGPRTVVIAGAGAGPAAEEFARIAGWPLLAEVTSGAHFGPNLVVAYRALLAEDDFGARIQRAIVFGHPTLSREVPALVQRDDVETIVVAPSGFEWYDPGHAVDRFERAVETSPHEPSRDERAWLGRWVHASRALLDDELTGAERRSGVVDGGHVGDFAKQRDYVRAEFAAVRAPVTRRLLAERVWATTWPHDRLVFGASRLIRDADRVVPGKRITVHANRGLAGIDGTIATALGIALASQAGDGAGVTRAVIGDLTFLHDVGSLLLGAGERRPRLQLIVGNDGGGTIFDSLEVHQTAPADHFDRVQFTPQAVDLAGLAAAYGWAFSRATTKGELDQALTAHIDGPTILEVPLPR